MVDNTQLNNILDAEKDRMFWVKPIGDPQNPPKPGWLYNKAIERIDFAKNPHKIQLDDILFVYAIGSSKLLYIADCFTPIHEATPEEIACDPWRSRWSWSFKGHNYTPTYGGHWWEFDLRPFDLLKEYNALYPDDKQSLGAIQHGQDKQQISRGFAEFFIRKVIDL